MRRIALLAVAVVIALPLPRAAASAGADDPPAAVVPYLVRDLLIAESDEISAYLVRVADRLLAQASRKVARPRVLIRSADAYDAFADDLGNVVVATGFLRQVESEDELAAVLAHELAHVVLEHNKAKGARLKVLETLDLGPSLAAATKRWGVTKDGRKRRRIAQGATATRGAGLMWGDVLAPSWDRDQEQAADFLGLDLMRAAGYDPAAFDTAFSKLAPERAARSERLEILRSELTEEIDRRLGGTRGAKEPPTPQRGRAAAARQPANPSARAGGATKDSGSDALHGAAAAGARALAQKAVNAVAGLNVRHDPPEVRGAKLKEYLARRYPGRRDKTPRSPLFRETLRAGPGGQLLEADLAALQVVAAVDERDLAVASKAAGALRPDARGRLASPHLNAALVALFTASRRAPHAEERAREWLTSVYAPAAAYLQRAQQLAVQGRHAEASAVLEQGASRLDAWVPFLPPLIGEARANRQQPRAEELTDRCHKEYVRQQHFGLDVSSEGAPPEGFYKECVAQLGYDPVAKREAEARRAQARQPPRQAAKPSRQPAKSGGLLDQLSSGLEKLGGSSR